MKSYEDAVKLGGDITKLCMEIFKSDDPETFAFYLEDNGGEEGDGYNIVFGWCAIDTGYPVSQTTIIETKDVPGYRVWAAVMRSGGHWEPDYMDDATLCETLIRSEVIRVVLEDYVSRRLTQLVNPEEN